ANCTDVRVHGLDLRGAAVPLQGAFLVNTSVSGVALNGNMTGMRAFGTEGLEVRDSSIRGGLGCLEVEYSFWVRVVNNTFDGCDRGVSMTDTWESQVAGNRVGAEAVSGISLSNSGHVRVASNTMMRGGLAIEGQAKGFYTTIDVAPDNTVGGLPLAFHRNETGLRVAGATVGQFIAVNCTGLQAEGVSAVGGTPGGLVAYSDGARLTGSRFVNSTSEGLRVVYSEGVVLEDVAASGNGRAGDPPYSFGIGLHVLRSSVAVEGGEFSDNTGAGIRADDSADLGINGSLVARNGGYGVEVNGVSGAASLEGVVVRENTFGIRLNVGSGAVARVGNSTVSANAEGGADARGDGELVVRDSAFTGNGGPGLASRVGRILIEGNRFVGNEVGLAVTWHSTRYEGNVSNNVFDENALGARIVQSALVRVFHNQFLRNEVQALTDAGTTRWDAGYPAGGNFWSDYNGTDRCTSDTQDICPIPDGLGDAPREVPLDPDYAPGLPVRDRYPLMEPAVRSSAQPPSEATPRDVPELLEFLTTLPGALLVLLALPAAGAAVVWVRQRRRGPA
ncbi:MAG TPA: right-handed parallel beta-helix repeat-containing protein, partial [Candidatus Thermoplasmatota archaeon]